MRNPRNFVIVFERRPRSVRHNVREREVRSFHKKITHSYYYMKITHSINTGTMAALRPVSSFGAPVLESLRVHTRRKRDERRRRKEQERLSRKIEKGTNVMLAAAPSKKKKKRALSRTKSKLRQPEGPGSSTPCPDFDGSITLATEGFAQGRIWNSAIPSDSTFDWADLACAIPTLLVMARKCAGIESLHQKCVSGLNICTLALSSCDSMRFEARRSVLLEDEYVHFSCYQSINR